AWLMRPMTSPRARTNSGSACSPHKKAAPRGAAQEEIFLDSLESVQLLSTGSEYRYRSATRYPAMNVTNGKKAPYGAKQNGYCGETSVIGYGGSPLDSC